MFQWKKYYKIKIMEKTFIGYIIYFCHTILKLKLSTRSLEVLFIYLINILALIII